MRPGRLDGFFERQYQRLGEDYLTVTRYAVLVPIYLAATAFAVVFVGFLDASAAQKVRSLFVGHAIFFVAIFFHMAPGGRRLVQPVVTWIADGRPRERLLDAWHASASITSQGFWLSLKTALLIYGFVMAYAMVEYSLGLLELAVVTQGYSMLIPGLVAIVWPMTEMLHRPVRRDLARRIGDELPPVEVRFPMGGRLLLSGAAIGVMTGAVISTAARISEPLADLGRLGLLVYAVGFTVSVLPIFLLSRSLLAPVEDLLATTRAVANGDVSARADVTTNDEIGELAHSFNQMLERLEEAAVEVRRSRARIVAASDAERKRIERNIHDGAQQQLLALVLELEALREEVRVAPERGVGGLDDAIGHLRDALTDLRELAQGLHPSVLSTDGLAPALELLAERINVPVQVQASAERCGPDVEAAAYFVASEALTNVVKHAEASHVTVEFWRADGRVVLEVRDDGIGGVTSESGSGLLGLGDRVAAAGGSFDVVSPAGIGTTIRAELPVESMGVVA